MYMCMFSDAKKCPIHDSHPNSRVYNNVIYIYIYIDIPRCSITGM